MSSALDRDGPFPILNDALGLTATVEAAVNLGILDKLDGTPSGALDVAAALHIDPRTTLRLLDVLAETGLVERGHDRYTVPAANREVLAVLHSMWADLENNIRGGRGAIRADQSDAAAHHYPTLVEMMAHYVGPASLRAAELLARPRLRVLDVGAGAAPWSLAIVTQAVDCIVTAVDLPGVIETTARAVESAGHSERFEFLAGDAFSMDLPEAAYDLVIIGNLCHLFGAEANQRLLDRLATCLRPGGTLAVVDVIADETSGLGTAVYRLGLALRTSEGDVYRLADYHDWSEAAGLQPDGCHHLTKDPPLSLITAHRPSPY